MNHISNIETLAAATNARRPSDSEKVNSDILKEDLKGEEKIPETSENELSDSSTDQTQLGVQEIEAIATVWTKRGLIAAYIIIWWIYFFESMMTGVTTNLSPYVTSDYAEHSLTPTVSILASVIGGCCNLTMAKILDVFGRPQGFLFCIVLATIGLIMMAACRSVEMYAAAQVFYTVGNNMLQYTLGIFIADTTSLKSRGLMVAYYSSANFITVWLASPLSQGFLDGPGWKWCYGTFAFIIPFICFPLLGLFIYYQLQARKKGIAPKAAKHGNFWKTLTFYCYQFDIIGLLLLTSGLALFLLPFNLYSLQADGWRSNMIICFLVFGVALMVSFALWEKFFARVKFVPFNLLVDRTVLGAYILGATLFCSYYSWNAYFTSYLQVVNDLSVKTAGYVVGVYTIISTVAAIIVGAYIRKSGHFKAVTAYVGVPLSIFGVGLMIHFREPDQNVGYIVMCLIFLSFGAGIIVITDEIAAISTCAHQNIAAIIAVDSMFSGIGGAIGLSISAAIWTDQLPKKLLEYLPADQVENLEYIYADLTTQLSYPVGSEGRLAIQHAYGDVQKLLLITGTAFWVIGVVAVAFWRNVDVSTFKQVKGYVI